MPLFKKINPVRKPLGETEIKRMELTTSKINLSNGIKISEGEQSSKSGFFSSEEKGAKISIDLYETGESLVIQSTVAGVKAEDLEISVENDVFTIRGTRKKPNGNLPYKKYLYQECYWGPFSRKLILPKNIDPSRIRATVKDGVLTIKIPKTEKEEKKKIEIKQED